MIYPNFHWILIINLINLQKKNKLAQLEELNPQSKVYIKMIIYNNRFRMKR